MTKREEYIQKLKQDNAKLEEEYQQLLETVRGPWKSQSFVEQT